jgi:hypothetical protein
MQLWTRLVISGALLPGLTSSVAFAQANFQAQVRGAVRDASGAVVVGAKVTITETATATSNSTTTDNRGFYTFNELHPSTYSVKAEMAGFRTEEKQNLVLGVSQSTTVDFDLDVSSVGTSVTVLEAAPTLDTGSAEVGTTVTGQYTRDMPLYGRSYYGLVFLSGGVSEQTLFRTGKGTRPRRCVSTAPPSARRNRVRAGTQTSTTRPPWK